MPRQQTDDRGDVILYQTEDGRTVLDVRLAGETVWLTLNQMADLFGRDKSVVSRHLRNIFVSKELSRKAVVAKNATTAADGKTYQVEYYNLDAIISVGYRVNSKRGTRFRIWAIQTLKEHLIRGYTLNERRLREKGLSEAEQAIQLLSRTLTQHNLVNDEGRGVLDVVSRYAKSWLLLKEYKAAHLLYFVIKDHPFADGNKRIGSFLFILFLRENNYLEDANGRIKINDNALVALALLIAESEPRNKELMIRLVMNLLVDSTT